MRRFFPIWSIWVALLAGLGGFLGIAALGWSQKSQPGSEQIPRSNKISSTPAAPPLNINQLNPIIMQNFKSTAGCVFFQTTVGVMGPFCASQMPDIPSGTQLTQIQQVAPPKTSADQCFAGQWAQDSSYFYRCLPNPAVSGNGPNTFIWGRSPMQMRW